MQHPSVREYFRVILRVCHRVSHGFKQILCPLTVLLLNNRHPIMDAMELTVSVETLIMKIKKQIQLLNEEIDAYFYELPRNSVWLYVALLSSFGQNNNFLMVLGITFSFILSVFMLFRSSGRRRDTFEYIISDLDEKINRSKLKKIKKLKLKVMLRDTEKKLSIYRIPNNLKELILMLGFTAIALIVKFMNLNFEI